MSPTEARRLYLRARAAFAAAFPDVRRAPTLRIVDRACTAPGHCRARDLAFCRGDGVTLLRRALRLSRANVLGLMLHELGHVYDPTPDEPGGELRADRVARVATGLRIRYDRRQIQTVGPGTARPRSLHK